MSAEILRRTAALMRERAEATEYVLSIEGTPVPWHSEGVLALDFDPDDAGHIAGMSPAVALAVADWLDTAAADIWAHGPLCECGTGCDACDDNPWEPHARAALAVARAYLGGE